MASVPLLQGTDSIYHLTHWSEIRGPLHPITFNDPAGLFAGLSEVSTSLSVLSSLSSTAITGLRSSTLFGGGAPPGGLDTMGSLIAYLGLNSDFERELFENYWNAKGKKYLSSQRFHKIVDYAENLAPNKPDQATSRL